MDGEVIRFSDFRGWGFIRGVDGTDYFVHYSMIKGHGFRSLNIGDNVTFDPIDSQRGLQAWNVEAKSSSRKAVPTLKINPFTPQDPITDPKKFAGRSEILINAIDCLFNNKNLLVIGARGIGKSSFSFQLINLTKGDRTLLERLNLNTGGFEFNHWAGDHRCLPGNTLKDIAYGLLSSLYNNYQTHEINLKRKEHTEFNLKFFKYYEETEYQKSANELSYEFVIETEKYLRLINDSTTGICFLIDEIDVLDKQTQLGPFTKSVIEKLRFDGYNNISFILSGVTGIFTKLVQQHLSTSRLFENFQIDPMSYEELKDILNSALENTECNITDGAKDFIIKLSDKFPAPVQLLGYHSFRLDDDNNITKKDVLA